MNVSIQGTTWQVSGRAGPRLLCPDASRSHHLMTSHVLLSLPGMPPNYHPTPSLPPLVPGNLPYLLGPEAIASFAASMTVI